MGREIRYRNRRERFETFRERNNNNRYFSDGGGERLRLIAPRVVYGTPNGDNNEKRDTCATGAKYFREFRDGGGHGRCRYCSWRSGPFAIEDNVSLRF